MRTRTRFTVRLRKLLAFTVLLPVLLAVPQKTLAQPSSEAPLPLEGRIADNGAKVELRWTAATPLRVGNVAIMRRHLGDTGAGSWKVIEPPSRPMVSFDDVTVRPGVAYEYQVIRYARDIVDVGYWAGGTVIPAPEFRGTALVVVDEDVANGISARLDRFVLDLVGDGWKVIRHDTVRGGAEDAVENLRHARKLRAWIAERFFEDPFGQHALVLVGHVPVPQSGSAAPDGHTPGPHPTDLFYADVDGVWSDTGHGVLLPNTVPSDFIEMQVGRIDFAPFSKGNMQREVQLLNLYFDKNHHWRHGLLGDLRQAYGQSGHLLAEQYGLLNIVGADAVVAGGHHDVGEVQPWLWGVDFGSWDSSLYEGFANRAVFSVNFGSGKQRFDGWMNPMTAMLAQSWYSIATGWGGRPAWRLHPMALGASIGEVHMRTVNNGAAEHPYRETMDYFPTGSYLWRNPVWVNLLGDPTTRAFPLRPPTQVTALRTDEGITLSWNASADPDVLGYRVYQVSEGGARIIPLTSSALITGTEFVDTTQSDADLYMVRAYGLKDVPAGSFYLYSQGVFARVDGAPARMEPRVIVSPRGQPVDIDLVPGDGSGETTYAFLEGAAHGTLSLEGERWVYLPPADFVGTIQLRVSASDGLGTDVGLIKIDIVGE